MGWQLVSYTLWCRDQTAQVYLRAEDSGSLAPGVLYLGLYLGLYLLELFTSFHPIPRGKGRNSVAALGRYSHALNHLGQERSETY